jgi:hypothetical protein
VVAPPMAGEPPAPPVIAVEVPAAPPDAVSEPPADARHGIVNVTLTTGRCCRHHPARGSPAASSC